MPGITTLPCGRVLVGISGSVLAAEITSYLRALRSRLASEIVVFVTTSARQFVTLDMLKLYADDIVLADRPGRFRVPHIDGPDWADVFAIVPASANTLGKAANGIADDLLSTAMVAADKPIFFAPAMNVRMWRSAPVRRNVQRLREDGHYIVEPDVGLALSSGLAEGVAPTAEKVLSHLWHFRMRQLRDDYWDEAISVAPRPPAALTAATRTSLPLTVASGSGK
ncbi:flavoprotein [Stackebrandtia nassauensis]|uniref:flavoprotein n=1 Tax=Stackebrandtia nassauensis TaxID=283811 RepID=UPI00145F69B3|nr:flavoprotein [Stackebrandtia nassauensis]